jgi:hypothetical protein
MQTMEMQVMAAQNGVEAATLEWELLASEKAAMHFDLQQVRPG